MGRFAEAFKENERALELNPISVKLSNYLAHGYYMARRYDEAIAQYKKSLELLELFPSPWDIPFVHGMLVRIYTESGMYEEALAEIEEWVSDSSWMRVWIYVEWGRRDEVAKMIEDVLESPEISPSVAARLGDNDLAFQRLDARYEEHHLSMLYLKVNPAYDNLRSDPRYEDLLRRMNFPE